MKEENIYKPEIRRNYRLVLYVDQKSYNKYNSFTYQVRRELLFKAYKTFKRELEKLIKEEKGQTKLI